jgi:hypothetical protein
LLSFAGGGGPEAPISAGRRSRRWRARCARPIRVRDAHRVWPGGERRAVEDDAVADRRRALAA